VSRVSLTASNCGEPVPQGGGPLEFKLIRGLHHLLPERLKQFDTTRQRGQCPAGCPRSKHNSRRRIEGHGEHATCQSGTLPRGEDQSGVPKMDTVEVSDG